VIPLEALMRAEAGAFALEAVRLGGLVIAAPLAWTAAPARAKVALVLLLATAAHGQSELAPELAGSPERIALAVGSEFLLGLAIGMIVRLVVAAFEVAAEQASLMMGLGVAQLFDPQSNTSQNVLSSVLKNFALLVALALGLHRVVIGATINSFQIVPVGSLVGLRAYAPSFVVLSSEVLVTGMRLAMPIMAVLFMTQVGLAFVSRAAPAMQIFSIGFSVTLAVGALVLFLTLPDLGYEAAVEMSRVEGRIESLLRDAVEAR
jgi:flagellar biosynthesis protein FliR